MASKAYKEHMNAAKPFLAAIKDFVYGQKIEYDNMWNVSLGLNVPSD